MVNFQVPVKLDAGRRWLEAGQTLVSGEPASRMCSFVEAQRPKIVQRACSNHGTLVAATRLQDAQQLHSTVRRYT